MKKFALIVGNPVSQPRDKLRKVNKLKKPGFFYILVKGRFPLKKPGFPPPIQETGFLREFTHPHQIFQRNPVSEPRPQSKKPGFCENLRILTRFSEETRFLIPAPK